MKKFSISVFILTISFFATHVYAQKFMTQEEYNALKDSLSRLGSDISKMNNDFKTTRDELRLTNNDIDFYLRKGYWSIEGTGRDVKSMPRWKPGKQNGSLVRVKYTVPVTFKLQ